jgi:fibronectin type 3 domain-containing protein
MNLRTAFQHLMVTALMACVAMVAGCSSGSGGSSSLSSSVVKGVAASGAPLTGKVYLKDASTSPREKSTDIDPANGSFAIDVTGMKPPYLLQATGTAGEKLYSFADGPGTANINPLSSTIVASAAAVADPTSIYVNPDPAKLQEISSRLAATTAAIQTRLASLLATFGATSVDPIKDHYEANHQGLDGMFDNMTITTVNNSIEIKNKNDDSRIFSGNLSDDKNDFEDDSKLPQPSGVPTAPSDVKALGGSNQVTVSWHGVVGATSYNIYWSTTTGVTKTNGTKISGVTSPYVQTGLTAGTAYFYIVTAVNSIGEGPASAQASATTLTSVPTIPAAPVNVSAIGGTNQVTISWDAVSGATSYNIYWSTTSGVTIANGTKIANASSPAVQSGLSAGTAYYYIVTAVNSAGESSPSAQATATTQSATPAVPAAPGNVTATGGTAQVTITWAAVNGATSYNIYWSTTTGVTTATGTKITGATSPSVQRLLAANTTYFYIVTAVNGAGESLPSSQASATTSTLDGVALYASNCAGCHGALASSSKRGRTAAQTQAAITANIGGMGFLSTLSAAQVQAIADVLNF